LVVGKNNPLAQFYTIQGAINSLPDNDYAYHILVIAGTYNEQLNVTRHGPITLIGQTKNPSNQSDNQVIVTWNSANYGGSGLTDNVYTSVLIVAPTLQASLTGSGPSGLPVPSDTPFGNTAFSVYNIDFVNDFAPATPARPSP
jgi:pectin methylesterase-like acyl-CoA thioesterase